MKKYRGSDRGEGGRRGGGSRRARANEAVSVLPVPNRIDGGDDERSARMDILNADTALSERPHTDTILKH